MKTQSNLADLGIKNVALDGNIAWSVIEDGDEDGPRNYALGRVHVLVSLTASNIVVRGLFGVSDSGSYSLIDSEGIVECDDAVEADAESWAASEALCSKIDWAVIESYLDSNESNVADEAHEVLYEAAERAEEARDPYGYRGLSLHDFR
jgi:hypothetical protein